MVPPPPAVLPIDLSHPLTLPPKVLPREKPDLNGRLHDVPHQPGVYLMRDRLGKIIYVGKAKNLRKRLSHYFQPARSRMADLKTRSLIKSIWDFEFHVVRNEPESLLLESKLIKEYRPKYNISLRDDKRFLLLKMHPAEPWPRFFLTRTRKDDGARYFGPFAHSGSDPHAQGRWCALLWSLRPQRKSAHHPALDAAPVRPALLPAGGAR